MEAALIKKRLFNTKDEVEVTFEVSVPNDIESVSVLCDAADWNPMAMRRVGDAWRARMRLPLDRHLEYRYLASGGLWLNDDDADGYGSDNSVVDTHRP
jgi:hypothetical protein